MSIARTFTKHMKRPDMPSPPLERSKSTKNAGQPIDRAKISSPVALLSTTNMLSYNAPDIATLRQASSPSRDSLEDSDHSDLTSRSRSSSHVSRDTLTDASSVGSSPTSPAPNHLSGYFAAANKDGELPTKSPRRSASSGNFHHRKSASIDTVPVPAIPERAVSHSKRAHERLAQKRSLQHMKSTSGSGHGRQSSQSSREQRTSIDMFKANLDEGHPFGKELEQLNEVAEEFGTVVRDAEMEADLAALTENNLGKFCAADYLSEIKPLFDRRFRNPYLAPQMAWI